MATYTFFRFLGNSMLRTSFFGGSRTNKEVGNAQSKRLPRRIIYLYGNWWTQCSQLLFQNSVAWPRTVTNESNFVVPGRSRFRWRIENWGRFLWKTFENKTVKNHTKGCNGSLAENSFRFFWKFQTYKQFSAFSNHQKTDNVEAILLQLARVETIDCDCDG